MKISEFAKLSGFTKRTLQYYDKIELLIPEKSSNGYRIYNKEHLKVAENIKFLKELDYKLDNIKTIIVDNELPDDLLEQSWQDVQDNLGKLLTRNVWNQAMKIGTIKESVKKVLKEYINKKK